MNQSHSNYCRSAQHEQIVLFEFRPNLSSHFERSFADLISIRFRKRSPELCSQIDSDSQIFMKYPGLPCHLKSHWIAAQAMTKREFLPVSGRFVHHRLFNFSLILFSTFFMSASVRLMSCCFCNSSFRWASIVFNT